MRWLGIDGGGTKTAVSIYSEKLERLDSFTLPTCHYAQAGHDGMRMILQTAVNRACGTGLLGDDFGMGFGICGYGENPAADAALRDICQELAGHHPYALVNDVDEAWAAGLSMADGIALIAGTGSIALGVRKERRMRCGGWDYQIGDEGSGGWLGKEALRVFCREADGRDERGALYDLVRDALKLDNDFEVIAWAQEHIADRGAVSRLAPLVSQAASAGDTAAQGIFEQAAREEADMVAAIARTLFPDLQDTPNSVPVTYIGGTFLAGEAILEPLMRALPRCCRLVAPAHEPALGAVLILRARLRGDSASAPAK